MADYLSVSVELEPHLVKFLLYHYGGRNVTASRDDMFGALFIAILRKPPYNWKPTANDERRCWQFLVEAHNSKGRGLWVDNDSAALFRNYVRRTFDLIFYSYIAIAVMAEQQKMTSAINNFRDKYDIQEDDLTLDAMKKAFYRLRQEYNGLKIKELKEFGVICPFFNGLVDKYLGKYAGYNKAS
jgi:hypothetical protein